MIHFRRFAFWLLLTFVIVGPLFVLFRDDQISIGAAVTIAFSMSILAGGAYALLAAIMSHSPESEYRSNDPPDIDPADRFRKSD